MGQLASGAFANLNFETIGYSIIASFLIAWLVAMAYYRYKGYEKIGFTKSGTLHGNTATKETSEKKV